MARRLDKFRRSGKKKQDSPDASSGPATSDEAPSTKPPAPSESRESTETAEKQVNSVQTGAWTGPAAPYNAPEQAQHDQQTRATGDPQANHGSIDGSIPVFRITVDHDHHGEGRGEDASPLWRPGLVGAFDGLGGAGGKLIKFPNGSEHTEAWLGSRFVRAQVSNVYERYIERKRASGIRDEWDGYGQSIPLPDPYTGLDFTADLRRTIQDNLDEYAQWIRSLGGATRVKSKLIKILPTTLAVCAFDIEKGQFTAIWAGDSRVFYLRPDAGLLQVTTDDLKTHADALKNLIEDSPMSNCVSAEADFVLHERLHELQPFSIVLAATDGCFGYVQTPLHFEHLLLSTMQESQDWEEWQNRLLAAIMQVTGDDSTLAAAVIGWRDFADCRERFRNRADWCATQVRAYDDAHDRVRNLERELEEARRDLAETKSTLWDTYRRSYEMPAETPTRDVPERPQAARHEPGPAGGDPSLWVDQP